MIRAVLLANVLLSGWNHWNELWTMIVITAVHVLLLVRTVGDSRRSTGLATVIFVPAQARSWRPPHNGRTGCRAGRLPW